MEVLLQNQVVAAIGTALAKVNESGELAIGTIPSPTVEPPKRPEWGDFSCNVAMTLALLPPNGVNRIMPPSPPVSELVSGNHSGCLAARA